jgi:hypothetical protein
MKTLEKRGNAGWAADVAKVKAFAKSAELKERMTAAGVIGPPDISILSA